MLFLSVCPETLSSRYPGPCYPIARYALYEPIFLLVPLFDRACVSRCPSYGFSCSAQDDSSCSQIMRSPPRPCCSLRCSRSPAPRSCLAAPLACSLRIQPKPMFMIGILLFPLLGIEAGRDLPRPRAFLSVRSSIPVRLTRSGLRYAPLSRVRGISHFRVMSSGRPLFPDGRRRVMPAYRRPLRRARKTFIDIHPTTGLRLERYGS